MRTFVIAPLRELSPHILTSAHVHVF